jgi:hypothetical protein
MPLNAVGLLYESAKCSVDYLSASEIRRSMGRLLRQEYLPKIKHPSTTKVVVFCVGR